MRRKTGTLFALLCVFSLLAPAAFGQALRLATVDMGRLFKEYYKTAQVEAEMKREREDMETERAKISGKFKSLETAFREAREAAQDEALSENGRDQKRELAEEKLLELKQYQAEARRYIESKQKKLTEQTMRASKRLADELREAVENYAREQGYTVVLDVSERPAGQVPAVLYSEARLAITDQVLKIVNRGKPEDAGE